MKTIITIITALLTIGAQAQSTDTQIAYQGKQNPALALRLPNKEENTKNAILKKMQEDGYGPETKGFLFIRSNEINGFMIFKGVQLREFQNAKLDLYFKVDELKKSDPYKSIIYLMVSKGYDNFVSPDSDPQIYQAAKEFLERLTAEVASYKLSLDIAAQEKAVEEAEDKLSDLKKDQKKMEKKMEDLKDDLKNNSKDMDAQKKKIESLRKRLSELKRNK
jgi:hypothetical protein